MMSSFYRRQRRLSLAIQKNRASTAVADIDPVSYSKSGVKRRFRER